MESGGQAVIHQHHQRSFTSSRSITLGTIGAVLFLGFVFLPVLLPTLPTLDTTNITTTSNSNNRVWSPPEGKKWCSNCTIMKDVIYVRKEGILCFNESRISESRNINMLINVSEGFIAVGEFHNSAFSGGLWLFGMQTPKCAKHVEQAEVTDTASFRSLQLKNGDIAFLAPPASGGTYLNLWHQIADILFSYFVTLAPIIPLNSNYLLRGDGVVPRRSSSSSDSPLKEKEFPTAPTATRITWLTMTAWTHLKNGCFSQTTCEKQMLFLPFTRLFHQYYFMDDLAAQQNDTMHQPPPPDYLRYNDLIIGRDVQCDVYAYHDLVRPGYCARALRGFNQFLLHNGDAIYRERAVGVSRIGYGADRSSAPNLDLVRLHNNITTREVTPREVACPQIRYVTRSTQRYRKVLPTAEFEHGLLQYFNTSFTHCLVDGFTVHDFVKPLSFNYTTPFDRQFHALQNVSILIAGRGAITSLSIGLPDGAAYFGLAGTSDLWEPYGHVQMQWITFKHYVTKMRRPEKPKHGKVLNPNSANYQIHIPHFIAALNVFYGEWKDNYGSWRTNLQ